jgi:hypothetical protein
MNLFLLTLLKAWRFAHSSTAIEGGHEKGDWCKLFKIYLLYFIYIGIFMFNTFDDT